MILVGVLLVETYPRLSFSLKFLKQFEWVTLCYCGMLIKNFLQCDSIRIPVKNGTERTTQSEVY